VVVLVTAGTNLHTLRALEQPQLLQQCGPIAPAGAPMPATNSSRAKMEVRFMVYVPG
jgi:hypothetical protein